MKKWLLFLLLSPLISVAQTYQYLGVEDGLSNRRVYSIQKDSIGYMWFLTHEGIDRYNGKEFKRYKLMDGNEEINSLPNLNWLYVDRNETLWEIGKRGEVFRFDPIHDRFKLVYKLSDNRTSNDPTPIHYSWINANNHIWLCGTDTITLFNIQTQQDTHIGNDLHETISDMEQIDKSHYFVGTEKGVRYATLKNNTLQRLPCDKLDNVELQVTELHFNPTVGKLFIGAFQKGVLVYDMKTKTTMQPTYSLRNISINRIKPLNDSELLIATDGGGIYKMNIHTYHTEPYILADYNSSNGMNGNSINDIYIDQEERVWMANYPIGITVQSNKYPSYKWIKHAIGNEQSLINDQVNSVIEDSESDLWFATNNGVSVFHSKTGHWQSFLSSFEMVQTNKNHIFTTLCEVKPGVIWVGGYDSGIYQINKKSRKVEYLTFDSSFHSHTQQDKYVRDIKRDTQGNIWLGGYYYLKQINPETKETVSYHELTSITTIIERNPHEMWVGSVTGLFLLDKTTRLSKRISLPIESTYIHSLHQAKNGLLYIGTSGSGLLIYNPKKNTFAHYQSNNCSLLSNNIYTILSNADEDMILSTENGLTSFDPDKKKFHNWTKEMGLMSAHFNALSGTLRKNNHFVFGSANGAIEFNKNMKFPEKYVSKMIFSDFKIFYKTVYPGDNGSPLEVDINRTEELKLEYEQNIFSLKLSSINYDYPSNIVYSWKLDGFYDQWSKPGYENIIRYTNLAAGDYTLCVRALSHEDSSVILEEKFITIKIGSPAWLSGWALAAYLLLTVALGVIAFRVLLLRKQRKISNEKIRFFINTAHDIRTPLTLIKAPLEELREKETFTNDGVENMSTALRNLNALLKLTSNLINFEKMDVYTSELYISQHEVNAFMNDIFQAFQPYATVKHIKFYYESNFRYMNVWFDKDKMESILKNLLSNALKYTPENGCVQLFVFESNKNWSIEVRDTGIGIPTSEQSKLFKFHFRGSNVINSKITGSGIGLMLVWKLVRLHKGKIHFTSTENKGSSIKVSFPKDSQKFQKAHLAVPRTINEENSNEDNNPVEATYSAEPTCSKVQHKENTHLQRILVVEDNDELRNYLQNTLSEEYIVQNCIHGKEALAILPMYKPELIISDIMMPEMGGDKLCIAIKNNIETSHIPVILLTALNDEKDIVSGLQTGADEYIVKPFNIGILKATIANLLANRKLLRRKFANLELDDVKLEMSNVSSKVNEKSSETAQHCHKDLDWKFITCVKEHVEENMDNPAFTVDMLCNLMGMSRTSLYNKIRDLTEQAPGDYIRFIRLKRAIELLKEDHHSITEVAEMTGFSDAKYFRTVFKKQFNMSPSQYIKGEGEGEEKE